MSKIQVNLSTEHNRRLTLLCATHRLTASEAVEQMIDGVYEGYIREAAVELAKSQENATRGDDPVAAGSSAEVPSAT